MPTIFRIVRGLEGSDAACLLLAYHRAAGPRFPWEGVLPPGAFRSEEAGAPAKLRANTVYYPRLTETMAVEGGLVHSVPEPRRPRPNLDRLLQSVARAYGERAWAVLLSGMGTDGVAGLKEVRARGGRAIVERPHSAGFPALPTAALREDAATDVLDARDIVPLVVGVMAGRDADAPPRAAAGRLREGKG